MAVKYYDKIVSNFDAVDVEQNIILIFKNILIAQISF